ncbi:eukaryotic translation initiation factor eIF2A-domain-containing protein [Jimgerdemannia flammicorona]|uniref:Eukaryotic translation initiation factor 2A n=1 Tax=Jimgerdemannia flammicorona TaxID=994334 RepID=A0A433DMU2_9FUNG|nr:eukaryotic translation initiation factor eIF2A-domain-containing protein [Jimgerdemannia flammicorona]
MIFISFLCFAPLKLTVIAVWAKLILEGISEFSLSPGRSPSVAVFIPEKKARIAHSAPAIVRMFGIPNFNAPLSNQSFYKGDKVEMIWNDLGTNLLVVTHTDIDKTGKSYYGETNLYHMSVTGSFDRVTLDKEGPIHDVAWSPNSKEFIVVYGSMPAKATLFDHRVDPIFDFGSNPRNFVRFNPHGRIICIAGFGNLNGTVDLWDRRTLTKISTVQASNASYCNWSPDGRYFLTATLTPRLRVDNGFKVWHYQGTLVYWESVDELYQIDWRPASAELYPIRNALSPAPVPVKTLETSPQEVKVKPAGKPNPAGAYRPPQLRGTATPSIFKCFSNEHYFNCLRSAATQALSKNVLKNKKKREAKKKSKEDGEDADDECKSFSSYEGLPIREIFATDILLEPTPPLDIIAPAASTLASNAKPPTPGPSSPVSAALSSSALNENDKKVRNIEKKLRQIMDLKEKQDKGEKLELTQNI